MRYRRHAALVCLAVVAAAPTACGRSRPGSFDDLEHRYVVAFLKSNPSAASYLGAAPLLPELSDVDGALRDYSNGGIAAEQRAYRDILTALEAIPSAALTPEQTIDAGVMRAQLMFLLHESGTRLQRYRCLDAYVAEPCRGLDWQIRSMSGADDGRRGTEHDWSMVAARLEAIPRYLEVARSNLIAGVIDDEGPDHRMIRFDGPDAAAEAATWVGKTVPAIARDAARDRPWSGRVLPHIDQAASGAAQAFRDYRSFLLETYFESGNGEPVLKEPFRDDRYAIGEEEYDWALSNNLRDGRTARDMYEAAAGSAAADRARLVAAARQVAETSGQSLAWDTPEEEAASTRAVLQRLEEDHPSDDTTLLSWYRGRCTAPDADPPVEIVAAPAWLSGAFTVGYDPPPLSGVSRAGRLFVVPTAGLSTGGEDDLRRHPRASIAVRCAREVYPGLDHYYRAARHEAMHRGLARWLPAGGVESSSSMWQQDEMTRGWALRMADLAGREGPGASGGAWSPAERLYQLRARLADDEKVRIDAGLHTGRLAFEAAVDEYASVVGFSPGACSQREYDAGARAVCLEARREVYLCSKWPTRAVAAVVGRDALLDLDDRVEAMSKDTYDPAAIRERLLAEGPVPVALARDGILAWAASH